MPRKYIMRSKEEKLAIVKAVLSGTPAQHYENTGVADHHTVMKWVKKYLSEGESGLEQKKKPGNPLSRYERRKELTYEEQLQYENTFVTGSVMICTLLLKKLSITSTTNVLFVNSKESHQSCSEQKWWHKKFCVY